VGMQDRRKPANGSVRARSAKKAPDKLRVPPWYSVACTPRGALKRGTPNRTHTVAEQCGII